MIKKLITGAIIAALIIPTAADASQGKSRFSDIHGSTASTLKTTAQTFLNQVQITEKLGEGKVEVTVPELVHDDLSFRVRGEKVEGSKTMIFSLPVNGVFVLTIGITDEKSGYGEVGEKTITKIYKARKKVFEGSGTYSEMAEEAKAVIGGASE